MQPHIVVSIFLNQTMVPLFLDHMINDISSATINTDIIIRNIYGTYVFLHVRMVRSFSEDVLQLSAVVAALRPNTTY